MSMNLLYFKLTLVPENRTKSWDPCVLYMSASYTRDGTIPPHADSEARAGSHLPFPGSCTPPPRGLDLLSPIQDSHMAPNLCLVFLVFLQPCVVFAFWACAGSKCTSPMHSGPYMLSLSVCASHTHERSHTHARTRVMDRNCR